MKRRPLYPVTALKALLFFLILSLSTPVQAQEQLGRPLITNYSYQDYDAAAINWWALEDKRGIMYFANGVGALQFDGVNWNPIRTGAGSRSLAIDEEGVIYVGGGGDFGFLKPDETGSFQFQSLKDKVPEEHRDFEEVWEVDYYKGRVIFRTEFKLYCWDGESMKIIESKDGYHVGKVVHDIYYLRIWGRGLCYLKEDDTFELVPGGEKFADERIYVILPYDEKQILIGTRNEGFYIFDGEEFTPFKTEADPYVKGTLYLPGVALKDGRFALNTFSDGVYLIDHSGKLIQKYTTENGLQDGSVDYLYEDSRGVLWMVLFNGLAKVNLNSDLTVIDTNMGLTTNVVFSIHKFGDIVYLGTNNGVYYLRDGTQEILPLEGTSGQVGDFIESHGRLYTGTGDMGIFEIKGTEFEYVRQSFNYDLRGRVLRVSRKDPNRIYVPHQQGLATFYFNESKNQLEWEAGTSELKLSDNGSIEVNEDGTVWFESPEKGEVYLFVPSFENGKIDLEQSEIVTYGKDSGLPDSNIGFQSVDGEVHFFAGDTEETYLFNQQTKRFEKTKFFYDDYLVWRRGSSNVIADNEGKIWMNAGSGVVVAKKTTDGEYEFNKDTFKELNRRFIWFIYPEEVKEDGSQVVWMAGPDGIVRYEGSLKEPSIPNFEVYVRSLSIAGDSLVYGGEIDFPEKLQIPFNENTVSVGYAAPIYINQNDVEYSTQLSGIDDDWSDWTKQTSREYINLPPGTYEFRVKAKNVYDEESPVHTIAFSITPPWFLTWWAYMLYIILFVAIVYFLVRIRTRILLNQQKELEYRVEERTREVQQRLNELATVNQVSKALTEKLELKELIKRVGDQMKALFKSDITYLAILDPDTQIINFPYQDGDDMPPMKYGEGLTSQIIQTGAPLLINKDTDIIAEYQKHGITQTGKQAISYLGVPIPVEDTIIGVLSVQSTQVESRFNEEDKNLLSTIAINVGIALHNAELYQSAREAKARAEDANEAKSAFLSTVSHELRTPLTSVLGFAKIIRKRLEDKIFPAVTIEDQKIKRTMKQVSENLNVVVSEGERLTNLINDVLDLAKIEAGRMEWNRKATFLQDVINRAVASTSSLFEEKGLTLKKNIAPGLPIVNVDEDKMIQVIINLLSNAVKFTEKGRVTLEAYLDNNQIIVEVQDTGIGIAEEDKHKIFERFRQAGDTLTDKPKGTGLGLPICREIIEHHGGIIWMKSEPGVGSTFFFSIPVMGQGAAAPPMQLERILKSLKKQIKHSSLNKVKSVSTILVVDDDTPIRSLLRQELSEGGYEVKEASNGKAALDMVRHSKPDLIILDVMMPEINGFDVAAVLKNDPATMDIPIIILSIVQDKERGLKIGVDRYLTKPINTEQLFHEVEELLEQGVSKKKVLVVDEDATAVKSLTDVLSARGYKVMETNAKNLFTTATESKPDIIMLNVVSNGDQSAIRDLKLQKGMENVMFFIYE